MNWKACAVEDLQMVKQARLSLELLPERIALLEEAAGKPSGGAMDKTPRRENGENRTEERFLENIAERMRLKGRLRSAQRFVQLVDKGLAALTEEEKRC